jgi:hypothetical protein
LILFLQRHPLCLMSSFSLLEKLSSQIEARFFIALHP